MRYRDDSPMPRRAQISEVGVLVSAYSRATSCFSSRLNLGRRAPRVLMLLATGAWAFAADTSCTSSTTVNGFSSILLAVTETSILRVRLGRHRAQILAVVTCARLVLGHCENIVPAGPYNAGVDSDVDALVPGKYRADW
jgi:hypothetical protein